MSINLRDRTVVPRRRSCEVVIFEVEVGVVIIMGVEVEAEGELKVVVLCAEQIPFR